MKRFGLFGPPTILFFGPDGGERANYRVVGYMKSREFVGHAAQALAR
jgi:thiol:disulfide interchange protein DsbD